METQSKYKILFVCLGNICRSPAAEAVMVSALLRSGLENSVLVDSASTAGWHTGKPSDERMIRAGALRKHTFTHRARQIQPRDLHDFDLILVMDKSNLADVLRLTNDVQLQAKVHLFLPYCKYQGCIEVPDPYYGGVEGFEQVLDMLEDGCRELVRQVKNFMGTARSL